MNYICESSIEVATNKILVSNRVSLALACTWTPLGLQLLREEDNR